MNKIKKAFVKNFCIVTLCLTSLLCFYCLMQNVPTAFAEDLNGDEYDIVFIENVEEMAKENYGNVIEIFAKKELLYDINLNKLGYIYNFTVNGENGYAIVINTTGIFEVVELFFDAENPYHEIMDEKRVYVNIMTYLYFDNNDFYFSDINMKITDEMFYKLTKVSYYSGNNDFTTENTTIHYSNKVENKHQLALKPPYLTDIESLSNECAAVAGANIIQYFDRYKTNLIANYTPGKLVGSLYLYNGQSVTTDNLTKDLYNKMGTNVNQNGTTINQFKNGLTQYIKEKGYNSVSFNSCVNNGNFNYENAKQKLSQGLPLALFLDSFTVTFIKENQGNDVLNLILDNATHVVAGFGYKEITYTLNNGSIRNDNYIEIATGLTNSANGYLNINYSAQIDEAFAINIE